jgi:hypothetical protein
MLAHRGHGAAANGTEDLAREDMLCTPVLPELRPVGIIGAGCLAHVGKAGLHKGPQVMVDNTEMGHVLGYPLLGWVHARDAFACARIFDELHAVPNEPSNIKFVP